MIEKPMAWLGNSRQAVRGFSRTVRAIIGFQLWRVQQGLAPNDWRPMSSVGIGVREIRIRTGAEHRVLYIATFAEAVYVLHVFEKRTRKTSEADLELARQRLHALTSRRARERG